MTKKWYNGDSNTHAATHVATTELATEPQDYRDIHLSVSCLYWMRGGVVARNGLRLEVISSRLLLILKTWLHDHHALSLLDTVHPHLGNSPSPKSHSPPSRLLNSNDSKNGCMFGRMATSNFIQTSRCTTIFAWPTTTGRWHIMRP